MCSKFVVFDIDETLGYFFQFSIFWECLVSFLNRHHTLQNTTNTQDKYILSQSDFNIIFDLYPEFIRPNIWTLLNYLKYKKMNNECSGIMIYTNNQGPKIWIDYIIKYFEYKINYNLFDKVIYAFKINGKQIEILRTSNKKSVKDLVKCLRLPSSCNICYIDDTYYPQMNVENVYYIKVKPYVYNLPFKTLIYRFINLKNISYFSLLNTISFIKYFEKYITVFLNQTKYNFIQKNKKDYEIDKIITKKIMIYLQNFFIPA
jgi:hypothetical protein